MTELALHHIELQSGLPWQETDPYYRIELPFVKTDCVGQLGPVLMAWTIAAVRLRGR